MPSFRLAAQKKATSDALKKQKEEEKNGGLTQKERAERNKRLEKKFMEDQHKLKFGKEKQDVRKEVKTALKKEL